MVSPTRQFDHEYIMTLIILGKMPNTIVHFKRLGSRHIHKEIGKS